MPDEPKGRVPTRPPARSRDAAILMCLAVIAVLWPLKDHVTHNAQHGGDYHLLHARRMAFAREALLERGTLPGWYPRDAMGTPFWSNVQSFPFIPTRLVLLAVPPRYAFTVGVMLSSVLAALFTFAFARLIGLGPPAAAAAGWTFACAGTHLSHVITGQLPMVEVYPALPLLLWLLELNFQTAEGRRPGGRPALALGGLALAATCVALAGHPQLAVYAFLTAGLYVLVRGWGAWRAAATCATALALGVACAAFALWPMLLLVGRSTRTLALRRDPLDIPLPYERLAAWVLPWRDGAPAEMDPRFGPFNHPPDYPHFYETVNYVGLLPLAAVVLLAAWAALRRERPPRIAWFLAIVGTLALVTALPAFHVTADGGGRLTLLRNPCRQTYVTSFALAMALGAGLELILRRDDAGAAGSPRRRRGRVALATLLIGAHGLDVAVHARPFIRTTRVATEADPELRRAVTSLVGGDGRVAMDYDVPDPLNRRLDDVGVFDSILLARTYALLLDLAGRSPDHNTQVINGSDLPPGQLAALGVRAVVTRGVMRDLPRVTRADAADVYAVPGPVPRAAFLPATAASALRPDEIHRRLRANGLRPHAELMLPTPGDAPAGSAAEATAPPPVSRELTAVEYVRPHSDEIVVRLRDKPAGYVRVLESFDPGWRATVNGEPAEVRAAEGAFLAAAVPAGDGEVRFTYHTPGAPAGGVVSLASAGLLAGLLLRVRRGSP